MSWSPFVSSPHGHPNYNPTKSGGKNYQFDASKSSKQPRPPDKPLMPYMRYSKKVWEEVRAQYPDLKVWEISKIVGQMWRDLDELERQIYVDEFESEKIEYNELLRQYHNSPAYHTWIMSLKSRENEERETHRRKDKRSSHQFLNSPQKADGRVSLQALETEEDNEEVMSWKHLAAARYNRNNKLVNEIFNSSMVPDARCVVTEARLLTLRRQVDSLTTHKQKLDEEMEKLEQEFREKKRCLELSSERFYEEMKKRFASAELDQKVRDHFRMTLQQTMEQLSKAQQSNGEAQNSSASGEAFTGEPAAIQTRVPMVNGFHGPNPVALTNGFDTSTSG